MRLEAPSRCGTQEKSRRPPAPAGGGGRHAWKPKDHQPPERGAAVPGAHSGESPPPTPHAPPRGFGPGRPGKGEEEGRGWQAGGAAGTYLLSLHSFRSLTLSHLRRRKRFRRGEALGVEQLDHGVSSSLEGVISMDGSCRNSLPGAKTPGRSRASPASRLCSCTFFMRRILKRRRRSVGVDELDQSGLPSGAPCGSGTCRAGGCRFSSMLAAGMGARGVRAPSAPSASRLAAHPRPRRARPALGWETLAARAARRASSSPGAPRGRRAAAGAELSRARSPGRRRRPAPSALRRHPAALLGLPRRARLFFFRALPGLLASSP